jgi:hypothetical protein
MAKNGRILRSFTHAGTENDFLSDSFREACPDSEEIPCLTDSLSFSVAVFAAYTAVLLSKNIKIIA